MIGSALLRRYIGRQFEGLRMRAGLTQEQAAKDLQRSRATLGRLEEGHHSIRFRDVDVKQMLELYGATEEESERLLALSTETRNGHRKGWWHDYTETALPPWFGLYVSLEDSAETIRQYEPELVPGLLQTRAYAEQVTRVPAGYLGDEEEIQRRVNVRMERQSVLTRPRAPHLRVVLNEAVLHRRVGDVDLMTEQLQHLLEVVQRGNVILRILTWSAGVHGGMAASGGFSVLDFPADPRTGDALEPSLVFVDTLTGAMYLQKPDEVRAYQLAWDDIAERALDETASKEAITTALDGLPRD
jgi:transcriptional regulator with XRE-family HTH domain